VGIGVDDFVLAIVEHRRPVVGATSVVGQPGIEIEPIRKFTDGYHFAVGTDEFIAGLQVLALNCFGCHFSPPCVNQRPADIAIISAVITWPCVY